MDKITINGKELTKEQVTLVEAAILDTFLRMPEKSKIVHLENYMKIVEMFEDPKQKDKYNQQ